jgi:hypothetical protein
VLVQARQLQNRSPHVGVHHLIEEGGVHTIDVRDVGISCVEPQPIETAAGGRHLLGQIVRGDRVASIVAQYLGIGQVLSEGGQPSLLPARQHQLLALGCDAVRDSQADAAGRSRDQYTLAGKPCHCFSPDSGSA